MRFSYEVFEIIAYLQEHFSFSIGFIIVADLTHFGCAKPYRSPAVWVANEIKM